MRKDTEMAKGNLIINNDWNPMFQNLPDDKAGQLIKALLACHNGVGTEIEDPVLSAVFEMMSSEVCENARKYEEKCKRNAENRKRNTTTVNEKERPSTTVNESAQNKNIKIKESYKDSKEKDTEKESPAKAVPCMVAAREIVGYLNEKTGKHFMASSEETVKHIKARLNEGRTIDDFKKVIDIKTAEWLGDPNMEQYLRPKTLFAPSNFESYLNQKPNVRSGTSKSVQKINNTISRTGSAKEQNDALVRQLLGQGA